VEIQEVFLEIEAAEVAVEPFVLVNLVNPLIQVEMVVMVQQLKLTQQSDLQQQIFLAVEVEVDKELLQKEVV
jgi:hypothetical protein